jgi:hypothetical protein
MSFTSGDVIWTLPRERGKQGIAPRSAVVSDFTVMKSIAEPSLKLLKMD